MARAATGPGRASRRRASTHQRHSAAGVEGAGGSGGHGRASRRGAEGIDGPGCGTRGRRRGLAGYRDEAQAHVSTPDTTGVEGAGGTGGPGCGARGRRRGLAGLRDDAPSEARGADDSRAGRRPRAHKAARPHSRALRRPEHPWGTKQPGPSTHTKTPTRNRVGASEPPVGIEPTTYSLRVNRSAD